MNRSDFLFDYMSLDDFEEMWPDRPLDEKWELIGGRFVRTPAGARWEHSEICTNLVIALEGHVRSKGLPCTTFKETFWLKHRPDNLAVFPDIQVHCGALAPGQTSIDDPVILIEVVTRGSEYRDRIEKKRFYERLESVAHMGFVRVDRPEVEVLTRKGPTLWEVRTLTGFGAPLGLPAISFEMPLGEIYRGVLDQPA